MKTIKITAKEERAVLELLAISNKACTLQCAYPEMKTSKKNCNECEFIKSLETFEQKLTAK